jgi:hypothetical protein
MKIEITKPAIQEPCRTPYGVIDKHIKASARLNPKDKFTVEYEMEVVTNDSGPKIETGFMITRLTVVADPGAPIGITTTHLREIPISYLIEATVHQAIYPNTQKTQMKTFAATMKVSSKQVMAAQIILNNPGESHAQLLMDEFGITEGSARNLKTRVLKSGLIPRGRTSEPALPTFQQMSEHGDYIEQVLEGMIEKPLPPSEWFALQEEKKKRKASNAKKKKQGGGR